MAKLCHDVLKLEPAHSAAEPGPGGKEEQNCHPVKRRHVPVPQCEDKREGMKVAPKGWGSNFAILPAVSFSLSLSFLLVAFLRQGFSV